jgi:hypothetical protein
MKPLRRRPLLSLLLSPLLLLTACYKQPGQPGPATETPALGAALPESGASLEPPSLAGLGALLAPGEETTGGRRPADDAPPSAWANAGGGHARAVTALGAADRALIARALCGSSPVTSDRSGFRCKCPSEAELDGGELELLAQYPGHFSGPGRDEVVVETRGCETGASSSQTYGGRALVRRIAGGWGRALYAPGSLGACGAILSHAGRSRLLCHRLSGHMGLYSRTFTLAGFDEVDGKVEERSVEILALTTHDEAPPSRPAGPVYLLDLQRYAVVGKATYEAGDERALAIELTVRSRVSCASGCPDVDTSTMVLPLRFAFDGSRFHLAAESQPAFARLEARHKE